MTLVLTADKQQSNANINNSRKLIKINVKHVYKYESDRRNVCTEVDC